MIRWQYTDNIVKQKVSQLKLYAVVNFMVRICNRFFRPKTGDIIPIIITFVNVIIVNGTVIIFAIVIIIFQIIIIILRPMIRPIIIITVG